MRYEYSLSPQVFSRYCIFIIMEDYFLYKYFLFCSRPITIIVTIQSLLLYIFFSCAICIVVSFTENYISMPTPLR